MAEQDNIKVVRKIFDGMNHHDLNETEMYLTPDSKYVVPGETSPLTREKGRMYTQMFIDGFPDIHFDVREIIAQGNLVAVTWLAKGTHKNQLKSLRGDTIPPTNRTASVPGMTIIEFKNDKITRQELYWDQMVLLTQLGLVSDISQVVRSAR